MKIAFAFLAASLCSPLPRIQADSLQDLQDGNNYLTLARLYKVVTQVNGPDLPFNQQEGDTKSKDAPTYDDLVEKYLSPLKEDKIERRTPQQLFREAIKALRSSLQDSPSLSKARTGLRDAVGEFIEAQMLIGNDALINALRQRFPSQGKRGDVICSLEPHCLLELATRRFEEGLDELEVLREFDDLLRVDPELVIDGSGNAAPNEMYRVTGSFERMVRSRVNLGKKLFNESGLDIDPKKPSLMQDKRSRAAVNLRGAGHDAYLGLAFLGAVQPDTTTYSRNLAGDVRAQLFVANRVFQSIRAGENPRGYVEDFIPSRAAAESYGDAVSKVEVAFHAENAARARSRSYDQNLSDLLSELSGQRAQYKRNLEQLTGLRILDNGGVRKDDGTDLPIDISKPEGRELFMNHMKLRLLWNLRSLIQDLINQGRLSPQQVDLLILPEPPPGEDLRPVGDIGLQILEIKDAELGVVEAVELVNSFPERIRIEDDRVGSIAQARLKNAKWIEAYQIAIGFSRAIEIINGSENAVIHKLGEIAVGYINATLTELQAKLEVRIDRANNESIIRNLLLDLKRADIALTRAELRSVQARAVLENLLTQTLRLLEDWAQARQDAGRRFINFPSYRIERDQAVAFADLTLEEARESAYFAAKAVEYEWVEPFSNPITVFDGGEDFALNPRYKKFTRIESVFGANSVVELADFLRALYEWHVALATDGRRGNPRGDEELFAEISIRENVLGLQDSTVVEGVSPNELQDRNKLLFQQWLDQHRVPNLLNTKIDNLAFEFASEIDSNRFFDNANRGWNHKIIALGISLIGPNLGDIQPIVELTQGGVTSFRRYPPSADIVERRSLQALGPESLADAISRPAEQRTYDLVTAQSNKSISYFRQNLAPPPAGPWSGGLVELSIAADRWTFNLLNQKGNTDQAYVDIKNLRDIVFYIRYTTNTPPSSLEVEIRRERDRLNGIVPPP